MFRNSSREIKQKEKKTRNALNVVALHENSFHKYTATVYYKYLQLQ